MKHIIWIALLVAVLVDSGCARQQYSCGGRCGSMCAGRGKSAVADRQGCPVRKKCGGRQGVAFSGCACREKGPRTCSRTAPGGCKGRKTACASAVEKKTDSKTGCAGRCGNYREKKNMITFKGEPLTLMGQIPTIGDKAPDFVLVRNDLTEATLGDFSGKNILLSVVPSLDTGICDLQTKRFNKEAALFKKTVVLTVSMDLPFAQARWCGAADAKNIIALSAHRSRDFGMAYGLYIKELALLARSVMVIGEDGCLKYIEVVPEIASHPDYEKILKLLRSQEE